MRPEHELPLAERVASLPPGQVCLAWHNFLKRLANGWGESRAKEVMIKELTAEMPESDPKDLTILYNREDADFDKKIKRAVADCSRYLAGATSAYSSADVYEYFPELAMLRITTNTDPKTEQALEKIRSVEHTHCINYFQKLDALAVTMLTNVGDEAEYERVRNVRNELLEVQRVYAEKFYTFSDYHRAAIVLTRETREKMSAIEKRLSALRADMRTTLEKI